MPYSLYHAHYCYILLSSSTAISQQKVHLPPPLSYVLYFRDPEPPIILARDDDPLSPILATLEEEYANAVLTGTLHLQSILFAPHLFKTFVSDK